MPAGFPPELHNALTELKHTAARIVESTCGTRPRAKDVAAKLNLHAKLGWQIWHVAFGTEFDIHQFLPNNTGIRLFADAARVHGASPELIDRFLANLAEFQSLVERHASSREMFDLILDAHSAPADGDKDVKYRRQAFLGNAYSFGVYAKTLLSAGIFFPGRELDTFGMARLHGMVGLVQNRIGIRWPISTLFVRQNDGTDTAPDRHPLVAPPDGGEVPLLADFCSAPLPLVTRRMEGQFVVDELQAGIVGLTGARTLFIGEVVPLIGPTVAGEPGESVFLGAGIRTPAELLIFDHFVHKDLFPEAKRELCIFSELASPTAHDERDRLPIFAEFDFLGNGLGGVETADIPNYRRMVETAFAQIDFSADQFLHYRVRLAYPPIPASIMVKHLMNEPADFNSTPIQKEEG